ncbi:hypothetical protein CUMW_257300 [Citrus unshiu]|uniref:Polygalacturonase n=1 Tax=Citrus unshiu TaxID=55188 RepID=A0A2H5QSE6_CITUN|nr:hypothetical protein CUMW_257300 [Citrus unshiu]
MAKLAVSCILFIFFINTLFQSASAAYNVINFGAKPDGKSDATQAFLRAWSSACYSNSPATLHVPRGLFLVKSISFNGPCRHRIVFQIDGTIIAPSSYWSLGNSGFWILFYKVNRLSIHGGTIDATGAGYWACRKSGKSCPPPTRSISFVGASNIVVSGLTSINSRFFHIAIDECVNIMLRKLKINAPSWSPNTDGIHIQSSSGITISNSTIMTGDDCISVGPGTKNLWIERIACGPGHGISIGSLGAYAAEDGAKNVTVTDSIFTGTQNGVRIKTWARPSNGFARNIRFRNIIMTKVFNPIIIDQNYCPDNHCPHQELGGGQSVAVDITTKYKKEHQQTSGSKFWLQFKQAVHRNQITGHKAYLFQ